VSAGEDIATGGLLALAITFPAIAGVIAVLLAVAAVVVIWFVGKLLRRIRSALAGPTPTGSGDGVR
jgi:prepilin signal peptidase PulO-like enzyme (type II secretory pathway)